jgi:23S rRNA (guanine1835-N2)-methyltransferase
MPQLAQFDTPFGVLQLSRRPHRDRETLQPWDAADDYLLHHLANQGIAADSRILIVNDSQGSLCSALSTYRCTLWADSAISQLSANENCVRNQLAAPQFIPASDIPQGSFDYILYKLPKGRSLLQYQLQHLRALFRGPEQFIGAAMARHIDQNVVAAFSKYLAPARPSLARKKARLIQLQSASHTSEFDDDCKIVELPELGLILHNRANVFSRDKLDQGSRIMLRAMNTLTGAARIADLACGNGLLGVYAQDIWPQAKVHFFDDSFLAIDSARRTVQANSCKPSIESSCTFSVDDCLSNYQGEPFDLILCNPPFHQDHHVGDHIARAMFNDSLKHLALNGRLCVVGNRHLGYHHALKKLFGHCDIIDSNPKFVVLLAYR